MLDKAILEADPGFSGEVLGSYRRGNPWCSDVDYIIRHEEYLTVLYFAPLSRYCH